MVGNLTTGKKKYAEVESEVVAHLKQLEEVRQELLELVEKDALAFASLADAFKIPRTPMRKKRIVTESFKRLLLGYFGSFCHYECVR